ncbi:transmembrane protein, putative [Actinidia rufa]|uniref:Transmembrane protein, putative n=1 Tax=Actinidia rufa TaxID=165716 RepID=A0A7J0DVG1_9ERIC|nr:transmembrane protein, putative [Actinidia rufa]
MVRTLKRENWANSGGSVGRKERKEDWKRQGYERDLIWNESAKGFQVSTDSESSTGSEKVFEAHSWEKIFLLFTLGWWMVTHEDAYNEIRPRGREKSVWCAEDISNGSRDPTMAFKFYEGGSEKQLEECFDNPVLTNVSGPLYLFLFLSKADRILSQQWTLGAQAGACLVFWDDWKTWRSDPVRSFTGREKYKRPLWITDALDAPTVKVQEMVMLSTSVLSIKWTIKGTPKSLLAGIGGDLIVKVTSQFTLNQISGQVIEHEEFWDLSASSAIAQAYFWTSRRLFATIEAGKDVADFVKNITSRSSTQKENLEIYPDPSGDPTKFFQRDDGFQRDAYQFALFLALIYFVVQFLRTTL